MNRQTQNENTSRKKVIYEIYLFLIYTFFLWILFGVFNIYQRLLLSDFSNHKMYYGYSLVEALILAKIILIGKQFAIGKRLRHLPIVYVVLYKTCVFSLFVLLFMLIEHIIFGYVSGHHLSEIYHEIFHHHINIMLAKIFIMFIIFIQFFSFLELNTLLGGGKLFEIFFKRQKMK